MKAEPIQTVTAVQWRTGGGAETITRAAPEETAIGICYDSEPYAVLMATPADLEDLATGFTITEMIASRGEIEDIRIAEHPQGFVADVLLSKSGGVRAGFRRRNLEGRSGCGLCGVESLEDAIRPIPRLADGLRVSAQAVQVALAALETQQPLGLATRATHAAAWADPSGELRLVREDVGRHNALDKLIGAAALSSLDPGAAFIVVTSRCSYEMVEKTSLAGVSLLAAISAPTALAITRAAQANLTLIALARADGHTVFTGAHRLNGH